MKSMQKLLKVMQQLRDPENGCPWDKKQTYKSILPYTLEETYEVIDAIEREDYDHLKDELGDLLFQVVFYCQIAEEEQRFDFDQVAQAMVDKLVRRHPHVFGEKRFSSEQELKKAWEAAKHQERVEKERSTQPALSSSSPPSVLDDVPHALPALQRAQKIQKRAAGVGFDWPDSGGVADKLAEELQELQQELADKAPTERLADELGDVMFTCVNLARHLKLDGETVLRQANAKFEARFRAVEKKALKENKQLSNMGLDELEAYWQSVK